MTEANRATLETAVKADQPISWSYSPSRARKYGVPSQGSSVTVRILDTRAQAVPDLSFTIQLK